MHTELTISQHLVHPARFLASPHANERPEGETVSLLVVHGISLPAGEFGLPYISELFCGTLDCDIHPSFDSLRELKVSAHCLIRRDGEVIQYVPFDRRAWHAGVSRWDGREECNDFSIGIELEGTDTTPYTESQYRVLAQLSVALQRAYPDITDERIVGHEDIAPGRKTDPGPAFNWQQLRDYRQQLRSPTR